MKNYFINLANNIFKSTKRFFSASCFIMLLFTFSTYMIIFEPDNSVSYNMNCCITFSFGILLCIFGKLLFEKYCEQTKEKSIITETGLFLVSMLAYPLLHTWGESNYAMIVYLGIMFILSLGIVYFADYGNISRTISYMLKNTVFYILVCSIVMIGTMLCILAFHYLIYEFDIYDYGKIYAIDALIVWVLLFMYLWLAQIPHQEKKQEIPNLFKIIVIYVALPVYLLLIAILYGYLGKILITSSFPSGQINWFASFASLLFVFFTFTLKQYKEENKLASIFIKIGGYFIIPIIVVQFMAMYIRLSNYGLTSLRYVSLVLNITVFAFAVVSLIKGGKYIKQMLIATAGAVFLLTMTPLNLYNVPVWEQTARLTSILRRNNMIEDGKIVANANISQEDKIKISSAYIYLDDDYNYGNIKRMPAIIRNTGESLISDIFGFNLIWEDTARSNRYINYYNFYDVIDVSDYSRFYHFTYSEIEREGNLFKFSISGKTFIFNLTKDAEELYAQHGGKDNGSQDVVMEFDIDGNKLLLTSLHFTMEVDNKIEIDYFDGYFLEKE